jgi:MFS family permease
MDHDAERTPPPDAGASSDRISRFAWIIGVGTFATNMSVPDALDIPIRNLLKNDLHLSPVQMATFFALAALPWYCKVVVGLLSDTIPFFGTRRRHYLLASSATAGILWLLAGLVPGDYSSLLVVLVAVNFAIMTASTVLGGLLAETEQRLRSGGRLIAVSNFVENVCLIIVGPLAGFLATMQFGITAMAGAVAALSIVPVALVWLREAPITRAATNGGAVAQLHILVRSRVVWGAGLFLFIAAIPQELGTPVFYYLRDELGLSVVTIGWVRSASGIGGLLAAALFYRTVAGRYGLRTVLALGIGCGAVGMFLFMFYRSLPAVIMVEFGHGFLLSVAIQSMIQLAVWATPPTCAATGFALLMGALNAGDAVGDILAAELIDRFSMSIFVVALLYGVVLSVILVALILAPRIIPKAGLA